MEKVQWNEIIELTILTLHVKLLFIIDYLYKKKLQYFIKKRWLIFSLIQKYIRFLIGMGSLYPSQKSCIEGNSLVRFIGSC